ncbi:MAG: hypothetical protein HKN23_19685 [Verrucomicrobiales bacterium]|nr:hypothetical protein [Verrucomicrobiales bacterium]
MSTSAPQPLHDDFRDFLRALTESRVRFLLTTDFSKSSFDLEIWADPERENSERLAGALAEFSAGAIDLTAGDLSAHHFDSLFLGQPPVRIRLFTRNPGSCFCTEFSDSKKCELAGIDFKIPTLNKVQK